MIAIPLRIRFYRILRKILVGFILASIANLLFSFFFYTPKMYRISERNNELMLQYEMLGDKIRAANSTSCATGTTGSTARCSASTR